MNLSYNLNCAPQSAAKQLSKLFRHSAVNSLYRCSSVTEAQHEIVKAMSSSIKQLQQSHIDLYKVSPIEKNRLIAFVNHFVVSVVKHLNFITNLVDSKLNVLNDKLNVCHSNLVILETKLNSISGLTSVGATVEAAQSSEPSVPMTVSYEPKLEESSTKIDDTEESEKTEEVAEEITSNEEVAKDESDETNELLVKYYKMLKIGVPLGAVHQKMITEGLDPSLLKV